MNIKKNLSKLLISISIGLLSMNAHAVCSMGSNSLNFGTYNPFSNIDTYSSTTITITCDVTTDVTVSTNSINNFNQLRTMNNVSHITNDVLAYRIYIDSTRDHFFGDGNNNTYAYKGPNKNLTIYGTLLKGQNVNKGFYQDSIPITIAY